MTATQRRITVAVCVIVGLSLLMAAGLTFLVAPMSESLELPDAAVEDLLAIPSVAALIAVFSAGQLGDRLGPRRTLVASGLTFSLGAGILTAAPGGLLAELGIAICAAAAITMQIVGVSLLQRATVDGPAQVSAFTTYGAIFPAAFLVLPVATAGLLGLVTWRIVPLIWVVAGLVITAVARTLLAPDEAEPDHLGRTTRGPEWWTPLLAGVSLAGFGRAFAEVGQFDQDPRAVGTGLIIGAAAGGICLLILRSSSHPGLSLAPIRPAVLRVLLAGVGLVAFVGLLTFLSITLEYFYDMTPFDASLAMIPAQIGAVVGAKILATQAMRRWTGLQAGRYLMLGIALMVLGLLAVTANTPAWYLVLVASGCSLAGMGALTVLNTEVMRRAPRQSTGAVSSFRTASSSLGGALGVGIFGTLIISTVQVDSGEASVTTAQLDQLAASVRLVGVGASVVAALGWLMLTLAERRSTANQQAVAT